MEFQVQKASTNGEWKTICKNPNEAYARNIYQKQLKVYSIGRFRLLDPHNQILEQDSAKPLFS